MEVKPVIHKITQREQVLELAQNSIISNYVTPPSGVDILCLLVVETPVTDKLSPVVSEEFKVIEDGDSIDIEAGWVYQQTVVTRTAVNHVYHKQTAQSILSQIPDEDMTDESLSDWEKIQKQQEEQKGN